MSNILVFVEQRGGKIHPASFQLLTAGATLAEKTGGQVVKVERARGVRVAQIEIRFRGVFPHCTRSMPLRARANKPSRPLPDEGQRVRRRLEAGKPAEETHAQ